MCQALNHSAGVSRRAFLQALPAVAFAASTIPGSVFGGTEKQNFVRVSPRDPRYFELSDGTPYIPNGLNMIAPPGREGLPGMEAWMRSLSQNGGNFIRVWLSSAFFDVEHMRSGDYDEGKAERIREMLRSASRLGIRVKMCLEHFRHLGEGRQGWAGKPLHHKSNGGTANNTADFFDGSASRERFKQKLDWLSKRFANDPTIFGWELWNEVNAVGGGDYMAWTKAMLPELRRSFPRHLVMQSLGSYDSDFARKSYDILPRMEGNDVAQVHRYLDLGAPYEVCHAPMDVLAADAVRELTKQTPGKPVLLAEGGGVEPKHTGPLLLYPKDTQGMLLHDVLFAPFFSGAAGPGHIWHWDAYVAKQDLWWHFGRFAEAIAGINCPAEQFEPKLMEQKDLRVYSLRGKKTILAWCRDTKNTWKTELAEGRAPEPVSHVLDLSETVPGGKEWNVLVYNPWTKSKQRLLSKPGAISLPTFQRSLVVRLT